MTNGDWLITMWLVLIAVNLSRIISMLEKIHASQKGGKCTTG